MTRIEILYSIVLLLALDHVVSTAQESTPKNKQNVLLPVASRRAASQRPARKAHQVIESYLSAVLEGNVTAASALAINSPASKKNIEELGRHLREMKPVVINKVITSQNDSRAFVVTSQVKLPDPDPDGRDTGRITCTLEINDGEWLICDIDFRLNDDVATDEEQFVKDHSDAKTVIVAGRVSIDFRARQDTAITEVADILGKLDRAIIKSFNVSVDNEQSEPLSALVSFSAETPLTEVVQVIKLLESAGVENVSLAALDEEEPSDATTNLAYLRSRRRQPADPLELAELYVDAVSSGDDRDAAVFAAGTTPTNKQIATTKFMDAFRKVLDGQSIVIERVFVSGMAGRAVAVSQQIKLTKGHPTLGDTVRVVIRMNTDGGGWVVSDVDILSEADATKALARNREQYPEANEVRAASKAKSANERTSTRKKPGGSLDSTAGRVRSFDHGNESNRTDLKKQLRASVTKAFEDRQRSQRKELAKLEKRFKRIKELIDSRERIKDKIIDHRVEELLNPEMRWSESSKANAVPTSEVDRRTLEGFVLSRSGALAEISVGADDGVKRGMRFDVFDDKAGIGRIEAVIIRADTSSGRILNEDTDVPIRNGDRVVTRLEKRQETKGQLGTPGAVHQNQSPHTLKQVGGGSTYRSAARAVKQSTAQVHFRYPQEASLTVVADGGSKSTLIIPCRLPVSTGETLRGQISNIPDYKGVELSASIELLPGTARTKAYLDHNAIPLEITAEDVDQALSGNLVTKVVYLPNPENSEGALAGVETLATTRLESGVDPLGEANRRGVALAILRLGNREPTSKKDPVER